MPRASDELSLADVRRLEREAAKRRADTRKRERLERKAIKSSRAAERLTPKTAVSGLAGYRRLERAQLAYHAAAGAWREAERLDLVAACERKAGELAEAASSIRWYAQEEAKRSGQEVPK